MPTTSDIIRRRQRIDWDSITITDNYMFLTVFSDPELCRQLLERLLGITVRKVVIKGTGEALKPSIDMRGIRMDVYATSPDTVYDIEMQTTDERDLERRSRYYQSCIDGDCIAPGMPFKDMLNSMVIFICTFDPFGRGLPRYTVTPHCREDGAEMPDGSARMFVNASAWEGCRDRRLRAFLRYVTDGIMESDKEFLQRIDAVVRKERDRASWRRGRMYFGMYVDQEREKARREGRAEGLAETDRMLAALHEELVACGREEEFVPATLDPGLRARLLRELGIGGDAGDE